MAVVSSSISAFACEGADVGYESAVCRGSKGGRPPPQRLCRDPLDDFVADLKSALHLNWNAERARLLGKRFVGASAPGYEPSIPPVSPSDAVAVLMRHAPCKYL